MVSFCACEDEAVTLLRMKLWPATPQQPSLAFQFELLDSYESLLLECKVALEICDILGGKPSLVREAAEGHCKLFIHAHEC